jgi:hypothetical protein
MAVDAARVLATFAIVWVHVAETQGLSYGAAALGRFGTSFYVIVAALFAVRAVVTTHGQKFSVEIYKKTQRLLRPFVVWSLLYALLYGVPLVLAGESLKDLTIWWGPFAGTAAHLWFLPFVFFWSVIAVITVPRLLRLSIRSLVVFGGGACVSAYYYCYSHLFFIVDRPSLWALHLHRLDRWIDEAPLFISAVVVCATFYRLREEQRATIRRHVTGIAILSAVLFVGSQGLYASYVDAIRSATQTEGRFVGNVAGAALLLGFLAKSQSPPARWLSPLGRYTYVAFLGHMLVLEVIGPASKHWEGYGTVWFGFLSALGVFGASILLSALIAKTRFLAWLRA